MARRILNRKDLRADYDAAERRKQEEDEDDVEGDEEETDKSDEEIEAEDEGDEEEKEAPKKKKKPAAKEAKPKRTRAAKQKREKVVWGVFNNSHACVAEFDYPKRKEADDHAAKLSAAKNPPQSFFVQPIRKEMEEKKE